jgi:hypothetical protein
MSMAPSRWARWVERKRDQVVEVLKEGRLLLLLGILSFAALLVVPSDGRSWSIRDGMAQVRAMLAGAGSLGDAAQDVLGFRRLVEGRDPYPVLGPALLEIGVDWPLARRSTHPPTAFLFFAPIARLPVPGAARWWCLTGFALVLLALRCYGIPWLAAAGLTLMSVLWRPFAASFHNLTFVWLAGVAVAYRFRDGTGLASGIGLGVASLTKILPAGVAVHFVLSGKWRALVGAIAVWAAAGSAILWMYPNAFSAYMSTEMGANTWETIRRTDNSSLLWQAYRLGGAAGLGALVACGLALAVRNREALFRPARYPDYSFFLYSVLAVALLPISWGYSLAPLLPVLGFFFLHGRAPHIVLALAAFVILAVVPAFSQAPFAGTLCAMVLFWPAPPGVRVQAKSLIVGDATGEI